MYKYILLYLFFLVFFFNVSNAQNIKKTPLQNTSNHLQQDLNISSNENFFYSPFSLYQVLSLLSNASTFETQQEIIQLLGFTWDEIVLLNAYNIKLNSLFFNSISNVNALWYPKDFSLNTTYKKILEENYNVEIKSGDFINKGKKITTHINQWFYENTDYKIKNMVESVSPMDKIILLNALYFKDEWEEVFDKKMTYENDFYLNSDEKIKVEYVSKTSTIKLINNQDIQLIVLPYKGDYEMLIYQSKDNFDIHKYLIENSLTEKKVQFSFPKFVLEKEIDFIDILRKHGIELAFESGADFRRLFKQSENDLYVSKLCQKNYIKVDEIGTIAVAATVAKVSRSLDLNDYQEIIFDRPFSFIIQHKQTKEPLFMGRINNPLLH